MYKVTAAIRKAFLTGTTLLFCTPFSWVQAQSFIITKTRAPLVNAGLYKQIAIGDIVGPSGSKTEEALNLSDELSSKLFNSGAQEILDRNALEKMLSSGSKLTIGDDKTVAALKKKLNSAVLLTGRIQTKNISQEEVSSKNIVVVNGCYYSYQWKAACEMIVQVKIMDIGTGKMLYNNSVAKTSSFQTKTGCEHTAKIDPSYITSETLKNVATEIARLLVPYKENIDITFQTGTLFKNPFKKLNEAVINFKAGSFEDGLKILKAYTEDNSLKDKFKAQAYFNYGLGLFCADRYDLAKEEIKKAIALNSGDYSYEQWLAKIENERALDPTTAAR
jgi:tetratricopeptide (TPR) repeat protein